MAINSIPRYVRNFMSVQPLWTIYCIDNFKICGAPYRRSSRLNINFLRHASNETKQEIKSILEAYRS